MDIHIKKDKNEEKGSLGGGKRWISVGARYELNEEERQLLEKNKNVLDLNAFDFPFRGPSGDTTGNLSPTFRHLTGGKEYPIGCVFTAGELQELENIINEGARNLRAELLGGGLGPTSPIPSPESGYCTSCGAPRPASARFCTACGNTSVTDTREPKESRLSDCGTKAPVAGVAAAPRAGAESRIFKSDGFAEVPCVYKVASFQASISRTGSGQDVAAALQRAIDQEAASGWEFVQIQELTTFVAGSSGCFGLGATPGTTTSMAVLVFKRK